VAVGCEYEGGHTSRMGCPSSRMGRPDNLLKKVACYRVSQGLQSWRAVVNTVMNIQIQYKTGIFFSNW
jgi:hypothetical protein